MHPERYIATLRIIVLVFVVAVLAGLGFWYLYIDGVEEGIEETSAGRGFGGAVPAFEGSAGSTFGNLLGEMPASEETPEAKVRPRLSQIHAAPVSGFRLSSTSIQFMDRSGYLYTADLATDRVLRTTNTLIPRVYRAILGDDALAGIAFDEGGEGRAFVGTLVVATSTRALPTIAIRELGGGVLDMQPHGESLLSLVSDPSGGSALVSSAYDGSSPQRLVDSGIAGWRIVTNGERIALIERAGTGIPGSAYEIAGNVRVPLLRDVPGLTALLGPGDSLLYGSDVGTLALFARTDEVRQVPLRTVAEKCAWLPVETENPLAFCAVPETIESRTFLDSWYRGEVQTVDSWWRIDASDGSTKAVYRAEEEGIPLDVYNPQVDPGGNHIVFQNKYDETLWLLRINE